MSTTAMRLEAQSKPFPWIAFFQLFLLGILGMFAVIPYTMTATGIDFSNEFLRNTIVQFFPNALLLAVEIGVGILLTRAIGLRIPFASDDAGSITLRALLPALLFGIAAGAFTVPLDLFIFAPAIEAQMLNLSVTLPAGNQPAAWEGLLASLYGAVNEEIALRLLSLSLFAWLGSRIWRDAAGHPARGVMWAAILIASIVFGLGHLPALAAMGLPITSLSVLRAIILNASGILFGWLFWKRGFEYAMTAHFGADLVLHVLTAVLLAA